MKVICEQVTVKELKAGDLAIDLPKDHTHRYISQEDWVPGSIPQEPVVYGWSVTLMTRDGTALARWVQDLPCDRVRFEK